MKIETDKYYRIPKKNRPMFWDDVVNQYPNSTQYWIRNNFLTSTYDSFILELNEEHNIYTLRRSLHKNDLTLYEPEEVEWV